MSLYKAMQNFRYKLIFNIYLLVCIIACFCIGHALPHPRTAYHEVLRVKDKLECDAAFSCRWIWDTQCNVVQGHQFTTHHFYFCGGDDAVATYPIK